MCVDKSMPSTRTPVAANGNAIRPGSDRELERWTFARQRGEEGNGRLLVTAHGELVIDLGVGSVEAHDRFVTLHRSGGGCGHFGCGTMRM